MLNFPACERLPFVRSAAFVFLTIFVLSLSAAEPSPTSSKHISKPNIILIMSDDMGYSDIGCYGGEIQTPNLNRLAENGVRFTQFYNMRDAAHAGVAAYRAVSASGWHRAHDGRSRPRWLSRSVESENSMTIAEVLKLNGYHTSMCGKWHVTRHTSPDGDKSAWPLQRGFDNFYGTITGEVHDPSTLCRQNKLITPENDEAYQPDTYYYTDAISDNAVTFCSNIMKPPASSHSFCTQRTRARIGRCMRWKRTSRNTKAAMTQATMPFVRNVWND